MLLKLQREGTHRKRNLKVCLIYYSTISGISKLLLQIPCINNLEVLILLTVTAFAIIHVAY